jgi:hypothetical protein
LDLILAMALEFTVALFLSSYDHCSHWMWYYKPVNVHVVLLHSAHVPIIGKLWLSTVPGWALGMNFDLCKLIGGIFQCLQRTVGDWIDTLWRWVLPWANLDLVSVIMNFILLLIKLCCVVLFYLLAQFLLSRENRLCRKSDHIWSLSFFGQTYQILVPVKCFFLFFLSRFQFGSFLKE